MKIGYCCVGVGVEVVNKSTREFLSCDANRMRCEMFSNWSKDTIYSEVKKVNISN